MKRLPEARSTPDMSLLILDNATLWIEHDIATHANLPAPPGYID